MPAGARIEGEAEQPPQVEKAETCRPLTRDAMRERLLQLPLGVMGLDLPIGSDASKDPAKTFCEIVVPRAQSGGVAGWVQHPKVSTLESMGMQPWYHPELGLTHDGNGHIVFNEEVFISQIDAVLSPDGIDFHPDAAHGYWEMVQHRGELGNSCMVRTYIATVQAAAKELPPNLGEEFQHLLLRALARGHIRRLRAIAQVVGVGVDDPGSTSLTTTLTNFSAIFGDAFEDNVLVDSREQVLRIYHDCDGPAGPGLMRSGAVDVIHMDSLKLGTSPVRGEQDVLKAYIERGGMFALGVVPQTTEYLAKHARRLGLQFDDGAVRGQSSYDLLAELLSANIPDAVNLVVADYTQGVTEIARESGVNQPSRDDIHRIARLSFLATTCGLGPLKHDGLRSVVYAILQEATKVIRAIL